MVVVPNRSGPSEKGRGGKTSQLQGATHKGADSNARAHPEGSLEGSLDRHHVAYVGQRPLLWDHLA